MFIYMMQARHIKVMEQTSLVSAEGMDGKSHLRKDHHSVLTTNI